MSRSGTSDRTAAKVEASTDRIASSRRRRPTTWWTASGDPTVRVSTVSKMSKDEQAVAGVTVRRLRDRGTGRMLVRATTSAGRWGQGNRLARSPAPPGRADEHLRRTH